MFTRRNLLIGGATLATGLGIARLSPEVGAGAKRNWTALRNGKRVTVNDVLYEAECGANAAALQRSHNGVFRFSMIPGNLWENDDPSDSERTELDGWKKRIDASKTLWMSWSMYYEPGPWSTADWLILRQIYAIYGRRNAPWGVLRLKPGGQLQWVAAAAAGKDGKQYSTVSRDIEQGKWLHFVETCKFDPTGGNGHWRCWLDGEQVVDLRGKIGNPGVQSNYAKFGIYRSRTTSSDQPVRETVNVRYANMRYTTDDLSHLVGNPESVPAFENWPG